MQSLAPWTLYQSLLYSKVLQVYSLQFELLLKHIFHHQFSGRVNSLVFSS